MIINFLKAVYSALEDLAKAKKAALANDKISLWD
jgi:hypothetical protein